METQTKPFCRKCLLKDLIEDEYFRSIYDYIEHLPEEVKTPQPEYARRLSLCMSCDDLINGMCRQCGCFVEVRAAKAHNTCPGVNRKW